jgi:hypothetical protein
MYRVSLAGLPMLAVLALVAPSFGAKSMTFTVRVENISTASTLRLSTGGTAPAPNSPGLWAVHTGANPFFVAGKPAPSGLEWLAEDGNPADLAKYIPGMPGVMSTGLFNVPVGDSAPGPALPGKTYEFAITAVPGCYLSLVSMFVQSNDLFYAPDEKGIPLFDAQGMPVHSDVTTQLVIWDAGTEVNQEPGVGADQAPRQKAMNTGAAEKGVVRRVKDAYTYPATDQVLRVTITPGDDGMAAR